MSPERRVKVVCWWCYMHTRSPLLAVEILRAMPTDDDITRKTGMIGYEGRTNLAG